MLYQRIFRLYDRGQHYGWRKPVTAWGEHTTIHRLLTDLTTYNEVYYQFAEDVQVIFAYKPN